MISKHEYNTIIREEKRACSLTFMIKKTKKFSVTAIAVLLCVLTTFSTVYAAGSGLKFGDDATIKVESNAMVVGEEQRINAVINSDELTNDAVVFQTNKDDVLEVEPNGVIKALKEGQAEVYATDSSGELVSNKVNITIESRAQLSFESVEAEKYVGCAATAPQYGTEAISATQPESSPVYDATAPTDVEASAPVYTGTVTINRTALTLGVGEKFTLTAGIIDTNNDKQTIIWRSSNSKVAKVSKNGLVLAGGAGTAVITASLENGSKASCTVTVKNAPTAIYLNKTSLTLGVGEQFDLDSSLKNGEGARVIDYTSSNSLVASVQKAGGIVTAKMVGTATITATTYNGKTVTCTVTVKKAPTQLYLNKTSLTLGVGEQFDLDSSLKNGEGAYSIVYTGNNTSVASVKAAGGIVTANKVGTAVITATAYNGKKVTCAVTVKKAPTQLYLNKTSLNLTVGAQFDLDSSLKNGEGAYSIVYTSNNTSVASVKAAGGIVTANKAGTAVITATAYNGVKITCNVTVSRRSYTDDDLYCLAAVIWQEAGASWASDRLQLMVANVVMNHVASPYFPNTIRGVLTRPYAYGTMAWTGIHIPVANDPITKAAIDRCYANAKKILDGYRLLPSNVIYQAGFVQGSGVYAYESGVYFCYM